MKNSLQAIITSIGESQFKDCLISLQQQPFDGVDVIENTSPSSRAHNRAIKLIRCEYVLMADADMVFYPDSYHTITNTLKRVRGIKWYSVVFYLYDSFLKFNIKGVRVINGTVAPRYKYEDVLGIDRVVRKRAKADGYKEFEFKKIVIGTHFQDPTPFEVYRRFLMRGIKTKKMSSQSWHGLKNLNNTLTALLEETKDSRYEIALSAFAEGQNIVHTKDYNIDFAVQEFERWSYVNHVIIQ